MTTERDNLYFCVFEHRRQMEKFGMPYLLPPDTLIECWSWWTVVRQEDPDGDQDHLRLPRLRLLLLRSYPCLSQCEPHHHQLVHVYFVVALRSRELKAYLGCTQLQPLDGPPGFFPNHLNTTSNGKGTLEDYDGNVSR